MCLSSRIDRMRCFRLAKKSPKSVGIRENGSRFWWQRRAGDCEAPLPPKRQRRRWSDRVASRRGERRQEFPPCLVYLFHIYHHKREEEGEEEEIIITGRYVCMHVFVRVLFLFEVLRMVVLCCWSGGRKINTYTSCFFVCFSFFGSVASAAAAASDSGKCVSAVLVWRRNGMLASGREKALELKIRFFRILKKLTFLMILFYQGLVRWMFCWGQ